MAINPHSSEEPNKSPREWFFHLIRSKTPDRSSPASYRDLVNRHYDGLAGWMTYATGFFTGHESLPHRLFNEEMFGIRDRKTILDIGCGNGRYLKALKRYADPDASLVGIDLSIGMLRRAKRRVPCPRLTLASADLVRLPFADHSFDVIVCGWVIEHLVDPRNGLHEIARVLKPDGKIMLLVTEDTFAGAICSRFYHCRTYQRIQLRQICAECHLEWRRDLWWTALHRWLRLGGIAVELTHSVGNISVDNI